MPSFPFFKQLDSMDCGPSCLRMVAKYYGKNYSLQELRSKSFIGKSGVSMLGISDAAENIGFRTRGYRLTWEQLRDDVPLPCIIHWNQRHFVVVYEIKKRRKISVWIERHSAQSSGHRANSESLIKVADPAAGLLTYTEEEFLRCWYCTKNEGVQEGTALLLEPTPEVYNVEDEEKNKLNLIFLINYIRLIKSIFFSLCSAC